MQRNSVGLCMFISSKFKYSFESQDKNAELTETLRYQPMCGPKLIYKVGTKSGFEKSLGLKHNWPWRRH